MVNLVQNEGIEKEPSSGIFVICKDKILNNAAFLNKDFIFWYFFQVSNRTGFSKYAYDYCLADAYSYVLLKDVVGLKNEDNLEFQREVGST